MFEKLDITAMAQAMAAHAGARLGVIARNVANADTPGYKAADLPDFATVWREGASQELRATRPGHLTADDGQPESVARPAAGHAAPNGNSVSLEAEMVKSVAARQDHEMALAVYRSTADIIRASLGRSR